MPEIAIFYGIIIRMFFIQNEHNPPHIHVIYGSYEALIIISNSLILDGSLPNKAYKLVCEWIDLYRNDLLDIWEKQEFRKLPPLE